MATYSIKKPLTLSHANGEEEKVIHFYRIPEGVIVVTSIANAYTVQVGDELGVATFFGVVPDRVDPSNERELVWWWTCKGTYEKHLKKRR
jgi:hypothetical protein